jgi:antitoxin HicB
MSTKDLAYYMAIKYPVELQEEEEGGYFVTHPDLDGCTADGETLEEAVANLADSRELWIETRLANGYSVPEPRRDERSGVISFRMAPFLHDQAARLADRKGISLNLLINTVLARHVGGEDTLSEAVDLACASLIRAVEQSNQRRNEVPSRMVNSGLDALFTTQNQAFPTGAVVV